ncbi:acetolactate synthase small subunit [Azospirillum agricola]|uniref:hypothetical protein n=1 Tax=Azospirillum agricola TaxID=1720247 RepID=UPI001AE6B96C|nr:hypothetical protein [Azospirillum agricola]MBP2230652.1 acetolactate synthase small subunit [Azospirillum agricola]
MSSSAVSSAATSTVTLTPPAAEARACAPERRVGFSVVADADPGTLPRILELVAKRGLVPDALSSLLAGDTLVVEMEVVGLPKAESDHIGNCLRQIPMVARVTMAERAPAERVVRSAGDLLVAAE